MNEIEFLLLPGTEREEHIEQRGEYITHRNITKRQISLYVLDGFFVEVHYSRSGIGIDKIDTISEHKVARLYGSCLEFSLEGIF